MTKPKYGVSKLSEIRAPILVRLLRGISKDTATGCWIWTKATSGRGYGCLGYKGKIVRAHRIAYEFFIGPIPEGTEIDHKCRVHRCCNPDHLEAIPHRENVLRGDRYKIQNHGRDAKAVCKHGHPWAEDNIRIDSRGFRRCKTCYDAYEENRKTKRKAKTLANRSSVPFRRMLRTGE